MCIRDRHYYVCHNGGKKSVKRMFKGTEKRFNNILCYIFSSRLTKNIDAYYNEKTKEFIYSAKSWNELPSQEVSIPFYDLMKISEA